MTKPRLSFALLLTVLGSLIIVASPAHSDSTINVTTIADELPADTDNQQCALREAIAAANNESTVDTCVGSGDDTINLVGGSTYTLTSGNLGVSDTVTINGNAGPGQFTNIMQQDAEERVFTLTGSSVTINFNDVFLGGGNCICDGAGVHVASGVTANLFRVFVSNNHGGATGKGGIFNAGTLNATESQVGGFGQGNIAHGGGGGLYNTGTATLSRSTVSTNNSIGDGGGINNTGGTVTLINSTVTGNVAGEDGGGIWSSGTTTLYNVTVTDNHADYNGSGDPAGSGGGVVKSAGTTTFNASIVAGNHDFSGEDAPDCMGGPTSNDQNLIGIDEGCSYSSSSGDTVGTEASPEDPQLGTLASNGGPTFTHLPSATSPAVDAALNAGCLGPALAVLTTDQRGVTRPQGDECDIGAVERDTGDPTIPTMTKPKIRWQPDRDVELKWTAATDPGGVPGGLIFYDPTSRRADYDEEDIVDVPMLGGTTLTTYTPFVQAGRTACFKVRSRDGDGNQSDYSNEKCTAIPVDDRTLTRSGNWTKKSGPDYYMDTYLRTKQKGAMLILNDIRNVKRMALIATKCPACGKVKVFMAGVLVKVISLQAATEKNNKAIPFGNFSPKKDGSAKIVVTTQGRPVIIEGLGISKL